MSRSAGTDRRRQDRRQGDRRSTGFGSLAGPDTEAADSRFAPRSGLGDGSGGASSALARVVRIYLAARAAIGVALVLALVAASLATDRPEPRVISLCVAYAGLATVLWLLPRYRGLSDTLATAEAAPTASRRWPWLGTIGVDVIVFVALHLLDRTTGFNFAALLVLPVLMAGVLMPRLAALAIAAAAALMLLVGALEAGHSAGDITVPLARAGLAGIGFFVIAVLAGELAARLTREEAAARDSLELARRQAQLNRLVIQEMADGVLVVDRTLRVRAANPAARALLVSQGLAPLPPFDLLTRPAWAALARAVGDALAHGRWPEAGREVELRFDDGQVRTVRLRVRFTRANSGEPALDEDPYGVLLLEDLRTAQARLRQEKLAAMGRVSAGIAHEIRNPLAAISQANALMLEDPLPPDQQRLARMVADNVRRLQRIVDEVMELAPAGPAAPAAQAVDATALVSATLADWQQTTGPTAGDPARLRTELPGQPLGVAFDPDHLRRVLVNLLDNAARHASGDAGAIFVRLAERDDRRAVLQVLSDGPPIPPPVERHLFEPFFSTRSRGSGLGLYICRELCERYGAQIEFRPRPAADRLHNEFIVTMQHLPLAAAPAAADTALPPSP